MSTSRFVPSLVLSSFVVVLLVALQLVQFTGALDSVEQQHDIKRSPPGRSHPSIRLDKLSKQQQQQKVTNKLLLLTDGQHIKLYPLSDPSPNNNKPLAPSGGYYVIKSRDLSLLFNNDELANKAPRYKKWLEYKQRLISNTTNYTRVQSSILPTRRRAKSLSSFDQRDLSSEQLYGETTIWKKPFITQVGAFFDLSYCNYNKQQPQQHQNKQCLVIYWLDVSNSIVHFGTLQLDDTKLDLLKTQFDHNGTTGVKHDEENDDHDDDHHHHDKEHPTIWLQELMPYEINTQNLDKCKRAQISRLAFGDSRRVYYVVNCQANQEDNTQQEARLLRATLESSPNGSVNTWWTLAREIYGNKRFELMKKSISLKNVITSSDSLIHLDNAKINVLDPMGDSYPLIDVQWETTKAKVRRMNSHKLEQPFSVVDMVLDKSTCGLYWLTSDHELYSSHLIASNAGANLETKYVGKLEPRRPLIREPITSMQILHETLFFMDSTRRSLMAYKLPSNIYHRHQSASIRFNDEDDAAGNGDIIKDKRVPKLTSTHQVLLVEMLGIQDFALINLNEQSPNSCQLLSELARRKHDSSNNITGQLRKSYKILDQEQEEHKKSFDRLIRINQDGTNALLMFEPIRTLTPADTNEQDAPQRTKLYLHPVAYVHLIFAFLIFALAVLIIFVGLYMELRKRKLHASSWESREGEVEDGNHRVDQQVVSTYKKQICQTEKLKQQEAIRMA